MKPSVLITTLALGLILVLEFILLHGHGSHGPLSYPGAHTILGLTGILLLLGAKTASRLWLGKPENYYTPEKEKHDD